MSRALCATHLATSAGSDSAAGRASTADTPAESPPPSASRGSCAVANAERSQAPTPKANAKASTTRHPFEVGTPTLIRLRRGTRRRRRLSCCRRTHDTGLGRKRRSCVVEDTGYLLPHIGGTAPVSSAVPQAHRRVAPVPVVPPDVVLVERAVPSRPRGRALSSTALRKAAARRAPSGPCASARDVPARSGNGTTGSCGS